MQLRDIWSFSNTGAKFKIFYIVPCEKLYWAHKIPNEDKVI